MLVYSFSSMLISECVIFYCTVYNEQRKQNESMQKKYKTVLSKVNIAERVTRLCEGLLSLSALCYTCFRKWRQIGLSTII